MPSTQFFKVKKLLIWDWDGTLANSVPIIKESVQKTAETFKVSFTSKQLEDCTRISWTQTFKPIFKEKTKEAILEALITYKELLPKLEPVNNAEKVLNYFHQFGYPMVLVSNKEQSYLEKEVKILDFEKYFAKIVGVAEGVEHKPATEMLTTATEGIEVSKENMVLVGDNTVTDIQAAKNFGIPAILYNPNQEDVAKEYSDVSQITDLVHLIDYPLLGTGEFTAGL